MKNTLLLYPIFFLLIELITGVGCNNSEKLSFQLDPSISQLQIVGEQVISTFAYERDFAISPNGDEIFFTRRGNRNLFSAVMTMKRVDGHWTQPEVASFSGTHKDLEVAFHPDGNRIFYASNRPIISDSIKTDFDIWLVDRTEEGWADPINLGPVVNRGGDEYYPSVASNGNLYFTASYEDAHGREDIYISTLIDGEYQQPTPLDSSLNTSFYEFNAYIAADESFIIYSSFGRPDGLGGGDLYLSRKNADGKWQNAIHFDQPINSKQLDYSPFVHNKHLFFSSERDRLHTLESPYSAIDLKVFSQEAQNGNGDIYQIQLPD